MIETLLSVVRANVTDIVVVFALCIAFAAFRTIYSSLK